MAHASDRYSDMVFKNSISSTPMTQFHFVEFPKWVHAKDAEGQVIASKLCETPKEELAFLQSSEAQPVVTKAEEENQNLLAMIAKMQAELEALKAEKAAPAPVVVVEMPETALEAAKRETKAKLAKLSAPEAE